MNKIPTAEEYFNKFFESFPRYGTYLAEDWKKEIVSIANKLARDKAKIYVKAALQAAADSVYGEGHQLINGEVVPFEKGDGIIFHPADQPYADLQFIINPDSILNAYPENFIV